MLVCISVCGLYVLVGSQVTQGEFRDFMEEACAGHTRDATIKECYAIILANKFRATKIRPDDLGAAIATIPRLRYLLQSDPALHMLLMPSSREALIDAINMNGDGAISLQGERVYVFRIQSTRVHRERNTAYGNMAYVILLHTVPDISTQRHTERRLSNTYLLSFLLPYVTTLPRI